MSREVTLDEYRTGYIAETHNVSDNAARALQLFEAGLTVSGVSKVLDVGESTAKKYRQELESSINERVTETVTKSKPRFDVYGERNIEDYGNLTYEDGVSDAGTDSVQVTDRKEQVDPQFRERETPLNKGVPLSEIPSELITIEV